MGSNSNLAYKLIQNDPLFRRSLICQEIWLKPVWNRWETRWQFVTAPFSHPLRITLSYQTFYLKKYDSYYKRTMVKWPFHYNWEATQQGYLPVIFNLRSITWFKECQDNSLQTFWKNDLLYTSIYKMTNVGVNTLIILFKNINRNVIFARKAFFKDVKCTEWLIARQQVTGNVGFKEYNLTRS